MKTLVNDTITQLMGPATFKANERVVRVRENIFFIFIFLFFWFRMALRFVGEESRAGQGEARDEVQGAEAGHREGHRERLPRVGLQRGTWNLNYTAPSVETNVDPSKL